MTIQTDNKFRTIAKRYTKALLDIAGDDFGLVDLFYAELKDVVNIFKSSEELTKFLNSPAISVDEKKSALTELFKEKINSNLFNFLCILAEEGRIEILPTVLTTFEEAKDEKEHTARVTIISAVELYDDEKNRLNEKLERKFSKKIIANYEIKQEILAGLIVQYGNTVIDFSLATKFKNMKKTLI